MACETSEYGNDCASLAAVAGSAHVDTRNAHNFTTQKFVRDVLYSNLPIPFQKLRTYLWLVVMTRALGAEGFGAWSLFILALSNATTIATLNCGSSLMRFLSGKRTSSEVSQAFSTVLVLVGSAASVLLALLVVFSRTLAAVLFQSRQDFVLIALLAMALPIDCAFEEIRNLLRARRLNKSWALLSLARLIPEIGATLMVAWWLRSVEAVSWTYLMVGTFCVAGGFLYLCCCRDCFVRRPSRQVAVKYLRFGLPLLPGVVASAISLGADKYIVGIYLGLKDVGIYSVCFTLSALTFFLVGPINDVLFPELSALYDSGRHQSFLERFTGIQKVVFGFSVGAAAILTAFPVEVLRMAASREFASGSATLALLGVQGIFMGIVMLYVVILNVRMQVWTSTSFWIASGALIVLLDVILIPRLGIAGAAISQLVATAAGAIVLAWMHWGLFRRTFDSGWMFKCAFAFGAVCFLGGIWHGARLETLPSIMRVSAGALTFLLCLLATGFIRLDDLRLMKEAVFQK